MMYKGSKMKFKGSQIPSPSKGLVITEKSQVVPDQSLSLKEILTRFTRHEPLPIGNRAEFGNGQDPESDHPLNIDLEKVQHMDLVEKQELLGQIEDIKKRADDDKKAREKKRHEDDMAKRKAEYEKAVEAEVEKRMKNRPAGAGSI